MEKYRRVNKPIDPSEKETAPNVVRITQKGSVGSYLSYTVKLLDTKEPSHASIYLKAMGNALPTAIAVAEKLRGFKEGLHQVVKVEQIETVTIYEPLEEGLDIVETARQIPTITIQLSYLIDEIDTNDIGYQKPLPSNFIKAYHEREKYKYKKSHKFKKQGKNDYEQEKENVKQDTNHEEMPSSPTKKFKKNGKKGKTVKENQDIEVVGDEEVQEEQTKKGPKRKKSGIKKQKQESTENDENGEVEDTEQVDGNETKTKGSEKKHRSYSNRGRRSQRGGRGNGQQVESSEKTAEEAPAPVEPANAS